MRGTIFRGITLVALLLCSCLFGLVSPAYADITPSSVSWATMDAGDDMMAQILDSMFPMDGTTQTTTGLMLEWFSAYVEMIASVWMFYSVIVQIHKTAESGKIFSASFSGWVPIRVVGAIIMMTPVASNGGYSLGQMLVMRTAKVSIGLARNLKDVVIDSVGPKALPLSTPVIPGSRQIVQGIINSELCRALINEASNNSSLVPAPSITGNASSSGSISVSYEMAEGDSGSVPVCGMVTMKVPGRLTAQINATTIDFTAEGNMQIAALKQLIETIRPSVQRIATSLWKTHDVNALRSLDSVFTSQTEYFSERLNAVATSAVAKIRKAGSNNGDNDSGITLLKNLGWTGLGSYYLEISRLNAEIQAVAAITPTTQRPSWSGMGIFLTRDLAPYAQAINGYMAKQEEMLSTVDQAYAPSSSPRMFEHATIGAEWINHQIETRCLLSAKDPVGCGSHDLCRITAGFVALSLSNGLIRLSRLSWCPFYSRNNTRDHGDRITGNVVSIGIPHNPTHFGLKIWCQIESPETLSIPCKNPPQPVIGRHIADFP